MALQTIHFSLKRILLISSMEDVKFISLESPFAVLVPAYNFEERSSAEKLVEHLMHLGCSEFCCVGTEAESLHDSIDWMLIDAGSEIRTTAIEDVVEACEHFIFAAGGIPLPDTLVALTRSYKEITAELITLVNEMQK